jgi:hypothetical protein
MGEGGTEWETSTGHGHAGTDGIYRFYYHPKQRVTLTDAREAFSADPSVTALALRTGNAVSRVIANFFLGLHKPKVPVRLVADEAEGVAWLQQFAARGGEDAQRSPGR